MGIRRTLLAERGVWHTPETPTFPCCGSRAINVCSPELVCTHLGRRLPPPVVRKAVEDLNPQNRGGEGGLPPRSPRAFGHLEGVTGGGSA